MQVTVEADFHQYYVSDRLGGADISRADDTDDGVLGPVGTEIRIATGMQHGPLAVDLEFRESAPPALEHAPLAAEADIELPSGMIDVLSFNGDRAAEHSFGRPCLVRVRVEVFDRHKKHADGTPAEHHSITVWPVETATPRWRAARHHQVEP